MTRKTDSLNKCTRCDEPLVAGREVWLELDRDSGKYYQPDNFPVNSVSQGAFPFGSACAKTETNLNN